MPQRMLRSGQSLEVVQSPLDRAQDARQGVLDLDPSTTSAERMIHRLAYENAQLVSRSARGGLPTAIEDPSGRVRDTVHGRNSKPDAIADLAVNFAAQIVQLSPIETDHPDDQDASKVNASIEMIAEDADPLVTSVIKDAEDHGLKASGPWLKIPLIETQAFEVRTADAAADKADDECDRKKCVVSGYFRSRVFNSRNV